MTENIEDRLKIDKQKQAREIIASLWEKLPAIAKDLIQKSLDLSDERNRRFFENPDDFLEHEPNWHQWGIITHTKMFEKFYREEIPRYLKQWGLSDKFQKQMSEQIDGLTKDQLLNIAILLHDLGKFTERKLKREEDGSISTSFKNHEAVSGKIIRTPEFSKMLKQEYGLTEAQIEYIACCAEMHYELGIVRDEAKKSAFGYTLTFVRSDEFKNRAKQIMAQYPDFQLEIGVLFLADSLAKTDIRIEADTDEQIDSQDELIKETLAQRGLNPQLIKAVKQLPVNLAVAEAYLKIWAGRDIDKKELISGHKTNKESEMRLETEMEFKIDIPPDSDPEKIITLIDNFLKEYKGAKIIKQSDVRRKFIYFDTDSRDVQKNGWTLRCVGGFNPEKGDGKNNFRYDYKIGEVGTSSRKEGKLWKEKQVSIKEIINEFNLADVFRDKEVYEVARADTRHIKRTIEIGNTIIELSLDHFILENGEQFQELEIEMEKGDPAVLNQLKAELRKVFPAAEYPEVKEQKYDRVLKLIEKKSTP